MFAKKITDSDAFTALPPTTQALYFHLCMNADDDGFNNKIRTAMFNAHADQNDFGLLVQHRFVIPFDSGVVVIKHWKLHNIIRSDRYHETEYLDEKSRLILKQNGVYTENDNQVTTKCLPSDNQMETEVSLGKDSIGKSNNNISNTNVLDCQTQSDERVSKSDIDIIVNCWNALKTYGIAPVSRVSASSKRGSMLRARIREYGTDEVLKAIDNIRKSDFLKGNNNRDWTITFDWFVKPSNFPKVLEGNYNRVEEKKLDKKPINGRQG